jgi:hypothetical protein
MASEMAARTFNRQRSLENIAKSVSDKAYTLDKGRGLERNSLAIMNKMYPNWQYSPQNGLAYQDNGPMFHSPYGFIGAGQAFDPGDGIRSKRKYKDANGVEWTSTESDRN